MAKVVGLKKLLGSIDKARPGTLEALGAALYQEGLAIMGVSVRQVPVDTGRLRSTHYVAPPTLGEQMSVELGYGTDYALPVHERLLVNHPVGKAKYLEDPMNAARRGYLKRLRDRAWANFKRGVGIRSVGGSTPKAPKDGV